MKLSAWVVFSLALVGTFTQVWADEDVEDDAPAEEGEEEEEVEDDEDLEAHEVTTSYLFPEYADLNYPIGKEVTILVDVSNDGQDVFNITRVGAFLHSPFDLNYYIQNFTTTEMSGVAAPSAQISLEYKFTPDAKLEALEYWMSGFVEYTMEGSDEPFQQLFFNSTVHLFEENKGINFSSMFTTVLMVAAIAAMGFAGVNYAVPKSVLKKKKKYVPPAQPASDDWEVDTYKQSTKTKTAGKGRKRVSKK